MSRILTLNAGSSSIKFASYIQKDEPVLRVHGLLENLGSPTAKMTVRCEDGEKLERELGPAGHREGVAAILETITPMLGGDSVTGVGHRVVHGGTVYDRPQVIDDRVLNVLEGFVPLAPLHQPHNLAAIHAAIDAFPDAVQVGCFDTAFHRGHPWVNDTFALPREYYDMGVRRYGFHGLSYDFITSELARIDPEAAAGRTVVAHLGNGASMCAIKDGQSIGSSMGFTALDGLPMGTRSGQIDPGVIFYLIQQKGLTVDEVSTLLYSNSGLKGLSGLSNDMRALEAAGTEEAHQAIDYFVFRIRRELGAMAATLNGIDTLIFCGGIGENARTVRAKVCENMGWLGIELDPEANAANAAIISSGHVKVRVIPTDEERVIARAVTAALA